MFYLYDASRDFRINRSLAKNEKCPKMLLVFLSQSYDDETRINARNNINFPQSQISNYNKMMIKRKAEKMFMSKQKLNDMKHYELYESNPIKREETLAELERINSEKRRLMEEERIKTEKEQEEKARQQEKVNMEMKLREQQEKELNSKRMSLEIKSKMLDLMNQMLIFNENKTNGITDRLPIFEDILIKDEGDHKVINEEYLKFLPILDLSLVSFDKVKVNGINFKETNARNIKLRDVYGHDISYCIMNDQNIPDFYDFTGINICGSVIEDDTVQNIENSIYDENTIFNGERLVDYLERQNKSL